MAKPKLQTSKKRVNKKEEELQAPDEVTTALHQLSDHLSKHLKLYAIGLVALIAIALAITWMVRSRQKAAVAQSDAVMGVVTAMNGSVAAYADGEKFQFGVQPDAPAVKADYADEKERWAAVSKALETAKADIGGDAETLLMAVEGRAAMGQGDMAAASTALAAFAEEAGDETSLMPIVLENQGRAAEEQQKVSEAAGYYEKLAGMSNLYYKVRGSMLLGDLYNPRSGAGKDKGKAVQYYDQALQALTPAEGQTLPSSLRTLRGEIARRKAQL